MIFDNPYIKDTHITFVVDHLGRTTPILVIRTSVDIPAAMDDIHDHQTLELIELLDELQSFATHDFADFRQIQVIGPHQSGHA